MSTLARLAASFARAMASTFTLDLRSLALFRMGLGLVIIADALTRVRDASTFLSDAGVSPRAEILRTFWGRPLPSLYLLNGSVWFASALLVATVGCAVALVVGWRTRAASIACWALVLSVQNRFTYVNTGADAVLLVLCLWGCFLPLGARLSLDARRDPAAAPKDDAILTWGTAALVLQIVVIYAFNVINKNQRAWWDGTAVLRALQIDEYSTPVGLFVRDHLAFLNMPLTYGTLIVEAAALLVLVPRGKDTIRLALFAATWALHLGFAVCMYLGLFSPACMVAWLAMLPAAAWRRGPLARFAASAATGPPVSPTARWVRVLIVVPFALHLAVNVLNVARVPQPRVVSLPVNMLRLQQPWIMFRDPGANDGWWVIPGVLQSGREVDVFKDGAPVTFEKPEVVSATYKTARWRKFMMNNSEEKRNDAMRKAYARWLCRTWNASHPGDDALVQLTLVFMAEKTRRDLAPPVPQRLDMLVWSCGAGR